MKRTIVLSCMLFVILLTGIQAQNNNSEFIQAKIEKFSKMKSTGIIMAVTGSASTIGGIVLLANADWQKTTGTNGNVNYQSNDSNAILGILLTGIGVGLVGGGVTMALIGNNKVKKYKKELPEITFVPMINTNYAGACLSLRF